LGGQIGGVNSCFGNMNVRANGFWIPDINVGFVLLLDGSIVLRLVRLLLVMWFNLLRIQRHLLRRRCHLPCRR
jgi:hypothetical protein